MGARIEKVETALLTEFHKWASPVITRLRSHSDALRTMDLGWKPCRAGWRNWKHNDGVPIENT
jgi:hypothetical protein